MELLFDTGASHTSVGTNIEQHMEDPVASTLQMSGREENGTIGMGDKCGLIHMLAFKPEAERRKEDRQGWLSMTGHTMPGLCCNILSGPQVFNDMGYDIICMAGGDSYIGVQERAI